MSTAYRLYLTICNAPCNLSCDDGSLDEDSQQGLSLADHCEVLGAGLSLGADREAVS